MLGNEEDFTAALGFSGEGTRRAPCQAGGGGFKRMIESVVQEFPALAVIATTLRHAKTATVNDWGAMCYCDGGFYQARVRENLEIYDRVGGGDSFASGLIYGFLSGKEPQWCCRMWRSPWRTGNDYSRRYDDGDAGGGFAGDEGANRAHCALNAPHLHKDMERT